MLSLPSYFFVVQEYEYLHSKLYTIFCFRIETFSLLMGQSQKCIEHFLQFSKSTFLPIRYIFGCPIPKNWQITERFSLLGDYHCEEIITVGRLLDCGEIITAGKLLVLRGDYHSGESISTAVRLLILRGDY